ncbi:hypothetical protein RAY_199 [Erwinia phage vB_EamM_RAY]|jgi:hypothetical protein|uniref:Uncharacterized protein n=10 Tax=Agricanvirus TaxID=1984776 RepID=A0A173GEC3_9CAUD|nr:hypothetical protein Ea357_197 [Erwinia phage Ea35-70]YP_009605348.1 hypothetical protein FDH97_gp205 [Erwinia phage vB_EamM_Deimos-Minion]YP_009605666.1 hypothetical protein FDH98_gp199 [Erwinia phage vB_EamM_RAY]YP_009605986.1 hypothetical protein FDH99_gp202 [Erwinia phage vB_EamM_Simmy50]YP_009606307.1 hypothetical protein FDI00_gp201 [Erwinia phage vB_EamM_Special G]YP_009621941.1 hypothetical protein FDJ23_gp200 [Erwinia phage vB_EamM_Desertfox]AUG85988.1 hypothetical protein BOSOLAP
MDKQREDSIVEMMTLAQRLNNLVVGMQVRKAQLTSGSAKVVADAISKANVKPEDH